MNALWISAVLLAVPPLSVLFFWFHHAAMTLYSTTRLNAVARPGVTQMRASATIACLLAGVALFSASANCVAQIPQGNGSDQQENRTAPMGTQPDPATSAVHESNKPQTSTGGAGNARGKTAGKGHSTQGAGGFENGLYGTGAGSNK